MSDIRGHNPQGVPTDISVTQAGDVFSTVRVSGEKFQIPGIGTAAAYTAGDAFGVKFMLTVPEMGTISNVIFIDLDDEGKAKELVLFDNDFTGTADNAAFDPTDADTRNCVGVVSIDTFYNYGSNQIGVSTPALSFVAPRKVLWCQLVTRGADNIAADNIPWIRVVVT